LSRWRGLLFALAFALAPLPGMAADWAVLKEDSEIAIKAVSPDVTVEGIFRDFDAEISFDPKSAEGRIRVQVPIASLALGSSMNTARAQEEAWFHAERWPQAVFIAQRFEQVEGGEYLADGMLTIRGRSKPLELPFSLELENGRAMVRSTAFIHRRDFGLGTASPMEDDAVARQVTVSIRLAAERR